jgi:glycosyltransferase involved in cell wall biosynthesis
MALIKRQDPAAHLLLVGASPDPAYRALVEKEVARRDLVRNVSILGERHDVHAILQACDIGVLSSIAEGLPLALVEYGMAGLPTVATRVGQCAEVLDQGRAGIVVPPGKPAPLSEALLSLLRSPTKRVALGQRLRQRARQFYSADCVISKVCEVYERVLASENGRSN